MCWFVTLGVPAKRESDLARVCAAHGGLDYIRVAGSPTTALFPPGSACVQVTRGGCSCDLYFSGPTGDPVDDTGRQRAKLAAKGWSSAKVERALRDRTLREPRGTPGRGDPHAFSRLLEAAIREAGPVQLFAHMYRGNQNEETVPAPASATMACADVIATGFPPDTLVRVGP